MAQARRLPIIAIISALRDEIAATSARNSDTRNDNAPENDARNRPTAASAGIIGARLSYSHCGVGLRRAMAHTERLCQTQRPQAIYFCGTAGALDTSLSRGTIVIPRRIIYDGHQDRQAHQTHRARQAHQTRQARRAPRTLDIADTHAAAAITARFVSTRRPLLTVDAPVVDEARRAALRRAYGAATVDMESYGVALIAARYGIPIQIIKCVSDRADHDLRNFHYHLKQCAAILQEALVVAIGARRRAAA